MSIQISVLLFASLAERAGVLRTTLVIPEGATVAEALDRLSGEHTAIAEARGRLAVAVAMEYVGAEHVLQDGDELALIPPVSGG